MQTVVRTIKPANQLHGAVRLPGDKSISHRYAMLGAIAEGRTEISGFASSADCQSTLSCLADLGVDVKRQGDVVTIQGRGIRGLRAATKTLDAGNSGSTMRMLSGILAGQLFSSKIAGDESLSRRPMKRIIEPLTQMGARIESREGGLPPLEIRGTELKPIRYQPPVASAQVKTAVLFAGLTARGATSVYEPVETRNHTEIALAKMGASITCKDKLITVEGPARLTGFTTKIPGDISAAAFFLAAAIMIPHSKLLLRDVGINPTRSAVLKVLAAMGGDISMLNPHELHGEPLADVEVKHGEIKGAEIPASLVPNLIDELPVLAVLGTQSQDGLSFRGASELRVKETDRLAAVARNLRECGAEVEEYPDGLRVPGRQTIKGGEVSSFGDHRIAMAFAVAGLISADGVSIRGPECVRISFPEFFDELAAVSG